YVLICSSQVTYDTTGFLEKNRDLLHFDSIQLLSSCKCKLPQIFAPNMCSQPEKHVAGSLNKSGGVDSQKLSAMSKFKASGRQVYGFQLSSSVVYVFLFEFFDDSIRNIQTAKVTGLDTVLAGHRSIKKFPLWFDVKTASKISRMMHFMINIIPPNPGRA
ncbi:hypothetical protein Ccrd_004320, partial [Cynara cardunculus var. scolymus]